MPSFKAAYVREQGDRRDTMKRSRNICPVVIIVLALSGCSKKCSFEDVKPDRQLYNLMNKNADYLELFFRTGNDSSDASPDGTDGSDKWAYRSVYERVNHIMDDWVRPPPTQYRTCPDIYEAVREVYRAVTRLHDQSVDLFLEELERDYPKPVADERADAGTERISTAWTNKSYFRQISLEKRQAIYRAIYEDIGEYPYIGTDKEQQRWRDIRFNARNQMILKAAERYGLNFRRVEFIDDEGASKNWAKQ